MQWRWAAALFLAVMVQAPRPAGAVEDALGAIGACIAQLDVDIDVGFERVAVRCPDLARQLQSSAWAAWLPAGWKDANNNLSARSLAQLQRLAVRERAPIRDARPLNMARLPPILAGLAANMEEHGGWWARLKRWLRGAPQPSENERDAGLEGLLGHMSLSQTLIEIVSYTTLGLIVLFACTIVANEWRAAGLHRRRTTRAWQSPHAPAEPALPLSWQDVEYAAPTDRPRVLFELLAARLTAARRLPAAGALTVRELTRAARLEDAADRERFGMVARAAEALRYSAQPATTASLTAVIARGRELFERLGESARAFDGQGEAP
jgi:hypothetical protein